MSLHSQSSSTKLNQTKTAIISGNIFVMENSTFGSSVKLNDITIDNKTKHNNYSPKILVYKNNTIIAMHEKIKQCDHRKHNKYIVGNFINLLNRFTHFYLLWFD